MQYILVKPESHDTRWGNINTTTKSFEEAKKHLTSLSDVAGKPSYDVQRTQLTFDEDAAGRYTVTAANGHTWFFQTAWVGEKTCDTAAYWGRLKNGNQDRLYAQIYDNLTLFLTNEYWYDGRPDGPRAHDNNVILLQFQYPAPKFVAGPGRVACQLEQLLSRLEKLD